MPESKHHRKDQSASEWKKKQNKRRYQEHVSMNLDKEGRQLQEENAERMKRTMSQTDTKGIVNEVTPSWWARFRQRMASK